MIGPETVMTTLYTAKKYAVPALERQCVLFLMKNLAPDNAFMLLTQVRKEVHCNLSAIVDVLFRPVSSTSINWHPSAW